MPQAMLLLIRVTQLIHRCAITLPYVRHDLSHMCNSDQSGGSDQTTPLEPLHTHRCLFLLLLFLSASADTHGFSLSLSLSLSLSVRLNMKKSVMRLQYIRRCVFLPFLLHAHTQIYAHIHATTLTHTYTHTHTRTYAHTEHTHMQKHVRVKTRMPTTLFATGTHSAMAVLATIS